MFNGMIDSREVQDQMRSSSQSLGGSSSHHRMEQNTANMRLQGQQDYNMLMHEYTGYGKTSENNTLLTSLLNNKKCFK
jgi:predicted GTPase